MDAPQQRFWCMAKTAQRPPGWPASSASSTSPIAAPMGPPPTSPASHQRWRHERLLRLQRLPAPICQPWLHRRGLRHPRTPERGGCGRLTAARWRCSPVRWSPTRQSATPTIACWATTRWAGWHVQPTATCRGWRSAQPAASFPRPQQSASHGDVRRNRLEHWRLSGQVGAMGINDPIRPSRLRLR